MPIWTQEQVSKLLAQDLRKLYENNRDDAEITQMVLCALRPRDTHAARELRAEMLAKLSDMPTQSSVTSADVEPARTGCKRLKWSLVASGALAAGMGHAAGGEIWTSLWPRILALL